MKLSLSPPPAKAEAGGIPHTALHTQSLTCIEMHCDAAGLVTFSPSMIYLLLGRRTRIVFVVDYTCKRQRQSTLDALKQATEADVEQCFTVKLLYLAVIH